jgi:hypothetical protein
MTWCMEFYDEKRGTLVCVRVQAPSPAAAVRLGRAAILRQHPPPAPRRRSSLFERAERTGGHGGGWILYRIARGESPGAGSAEPDAQVSSVSSSPMLAATTSTS